MKRVLMILFAAAAVIVGLSLYRIRTDASSSISASFLRTQSAVQPTTAAVIASSTPTDAETRPASAVQAIYSTPISFFGKVQDQSGTDISGARIWFTAIDKFWEGGSSYETTSDAQGLFSIERIKGAGLTVGVTKEGYDGVHGLSYQSFGYGMPPDSRRKPPPRKEKPAIFVLRKKAIAEPLYQVRRDTPINTDGSPLEISLQTGKAVTQGKGDIVIECWTSEIRKNSHDPYDWHFRLSVPGGGIILRTDAQGTFEAPEQGYVGEVEVNFPKSRPQWRADSDEQYWVKLRNGTYARMRLRINSDKSQFVTVAAYLNPSGSRNLEYDENKVIR